MITHSPASIRRLAHALAALLVLALSTSVLAQAAPTPAALAGLDARAAVEVANAWKGNGVTSFVTPEAVHFEFPSGQRVVVPMPDDVMLVSVAPYFTHTHPCATHYMSGCQGELVGAPVHVQALLPNGTVVIDEVMPTMANGFIDLWLPRGQSLDVRMTLDGATATGLITTHADSETCITTLQLTAAR